MARLRRDNHSVQSTRVLGLTSSEDLRASRRAGSLTHVTSLRIPGFSSRPCHLPASPPGSGRTCRWPSKPQHARALPHLCGDRGERPPAGPRRHRECGCGSYLICSASRLCCADRFPRDFDSAAQEWEQQNLQQQIEGRAA